MENVITRIWTEKLEKSGYRLTKPRKIILNKLNNNSKPLSADDIFLMIKKEYPNIGIATVYRTLELLTRLKLISKINFGNEKSFYIFSDENFNLMICKNCGTIVQNNRCLNNAIKIRLKENAEENILENCNIKIDNYQVIFSGLCKNCI